MKQIKADSATGSAAVHKEARTSVETIAAGEIDRVVSLVKRRLTTKGLARAGRYDFSVTVHGKDGRLRLESPNARPTKSAPPVPAAPVPDLRTPGWDPYEAGRRIVEEFKAAEGGAWTGEDLGKEFQLTPATLHARRRDFRIVSWQDALGRFHYPRWQFNGAGALLPGIQEVLQTFRSRDQWGVMRYFLSPRLQLDGQTPLALLRAGEADKVLAHARVHAQENTW